MAAKTQVNPRRIYNASNTILADAKLLIDGSATWRSGEFLRLASDGLLYQCTSGAASGVAADAINFLALTDHMTATTGIDTNYATVGAIHEDDVFEMYAYNTATITTAQIGLWYDLRVASNLDTINTGSSSHATLEIVKPKSQVEPLQFDSADTNACAYVKVLERSLKAAKAS